MTDRLTDRPFAWRARGDEIEISYRSSAVTVLRGEAARKFVARVAGLDEAAGQQLMARLTGNFKRGNERPGRLR